MTINDLLQKKNYTIYRLSKLSGISRTTLFDIFSGKSNILDCRVRILMQLAKALDVKIDEIISLEPILYNPIYEENMPDFLFESIKIIRDKRNQNSPLFDCYLDEANSCINVCEVENLISKEHADYLRNKYLR